VEGQRPRLPPYHHLTGGLTTAGSTGGRVDAVSRSVPPTLEDVAEAAGVSRATASRVINGSRRVSPAAVEAVEAAIASLHYVPNRAARSLANRQTMAIALVIPEDAGRFFGDPYFAATVQGITRIINDSDYVLSLHLAASSNPHEKTVRYLLGGNVDGALVVSHHARDHFLDGLGDALPVVFGGRLDAEDAYWVDVDNEDAAYRATRHLIDAGRTRIATITGPQDMRSSLDRRDGWLRALHEVGLDASRTATGDYTLSSGARGMRELLAAHPDLDAVFVGSDLMALGALTVLRSRGLEVPGDVAVIGFDDSPAATEGELQLTTVYQPAAEMGETMAHMLLQLLAGERPEQHRVLDTRLVVRDSA
jgi:DNA-binding LacI/PurR family transcriptional regulator